MERYRECIGKIPFNVLFLAYSCRNLLIVLGAIDFHTMERQNDMAIGAYERLYLRYTGSKERGHGDQAQLSKAFSQ